MIRRSHSIRERLGNRLLTGEELLSRGGNLSGTRNKHYAFSPEDVQFTGPFHEIRIPLPNMDNEEVEVSVINGMLIVKGNCVNETVIEENGYISREKEMKSFETVFDLNPEVDVDKISASIVHDELILRLYKCDEPKDCTRINRQIAIN